MGSTISVSRRVGALRLNGITYYALMETCYESNVYPHTPSEECVGFGTLDTVVKRILLSARDTIGGMLRRPNGDFTMMGYINSWLDQLKAPHAMHGNGFKVTFGGFGSTFDPNNRAYVEHRLRQAGFTDEADKVRDGKELHLDLSQHADIAALLCDPDWKERCWPGKLITSYALYPFPDKEPGPSFRGVATAEELPRIYAGELYGPNDQHQVIHFVEPIPGEPLLKDDWRVQQELLVHFATTLGAEDAVRSVKGLDKMLKGKLDPIPADAILIFDVREQRRHWRADVTEGYMASFTPEEQKYQGFAIARWGDFSKRCKLTSYSMPTECMTLLMPATTHPEQGRTADLFGMAA